MEGGVVLGERAHPRPRLLLVDDEESVLVTLTAILQQEGYEVLAIQNPVAALEAVRHGTFDLLLTDMRLGPEMDGLQLVRELHRRDPDAVALVLTGYGTLESAVESIDAGVFSYLAKPSNIGQLKETIDRGLDKRRLHQALLQVDRFGFLAHVGEELSRSLDYRTMLGRLAQLTIPYLADWAVVDVLDGDHGTVQQVAVAHVDPAKETLAREVQRRFEPISSGRPTAIEAVLRTGTSHLVPDISADSLAEAPADGDYLELVRQLAPRSMLAVAIRGRDDILGVLSLLYSDSGRRYTQDDVSFAEALGRRSGLLIENARLYTQANQAKRQLDAILSGVADGITAQTPDGRLVYANDTVANLCGLASAAELLATPTADIFAQVELFDEAGKPFDVANLPGRRAFQSGIPHDVVLRYRYKGSDEERWSVVKARPVLDEHGRLEMIINLTEDITAMKAAERQKEEFLAAAAHDLQTPITSVSGFVQLIRRRLERGGSADERTIADLHKIEVAAEAMKGLVREFLDLTWLQTNPAMELDASPTDLVELTRELVDHAQAASQRHRLRLRSTSKALIGNWDGARLKRAVANLLSNAIKFSPEGGEVQIEIAKANQAGQRWAMLSVSDRGIGVPEDERQHIFERFHRAANVVGFIHGTGLGLSYAKQVFESHGGGLEVSSLQQGGSTFTARLPLLASDEGQR